MSRLESAQRLDAFGLNVVPARGKKPSVEWKQFQHERTTPYLTGWFKPNGAAPLNLWVACGLISRVVVLDCDGTAAERYWREKLGDLLDRTTCVQTARGLHYWFRITSGEWPSWSKHEDGVDFEVRGEGGGVIAPPSVHETGFVYRWVRNLRQLQDAPEALRGAPSNAAPTRSKLAELLTNPPKGRDSGRNVWLAAVAGHYAKMTPFRDAFDAQVDVAHSLLAPLKDDEVTRLKDSIWTTERAKGDVELEKERTRQRNWRQVTRELKAEEAQAGFEAPLSTFDGAAELAVIDAPLEWTVDDLMQPDHQTTFAAAFKLGKTTVTVNLVRGWCDDEPFLGRFKVNSRGARVGFWNYEMNGRQFRDWLRSLGIAHPERSSYLHLRGERVPLLSDVGAEFAVKWLREREVGLWIVDPWSGLLRHSLIPENDNDLVGQLTDRLDRICKEAGVVNVLATAHTGRTKQEEDEEHQRGATRADDWPDVRWTLVQEKGKRLFRAFGRDVDLPWSELKFDPVTKRLTLADLPGGREQARSEGNAAQLAQIGQQIRGLLRKQPGHKLTATKLAELLGGRPETAIAARRVAVERGWTCEVSEGPGKPTWISLVAEEPS